MRATCPDHLTLLDFYRHNNISWSIQVMKFQEQLYVTLRYLTLSLLLVSHDNVPQTS